jgi:hypothetical protein
MQPSFRRAGVALAVALASPAFADFSGQPILGPLAPGGFAAGTTAGKADDNDGWDSGLHIFDIWDGGDDVYRLDWPGGDLTVTLDSLQGADNDLFLYRPGHLDSSDDFSIAGPHDIVSILAAPAGAYFINIDSTAFSEGAYHIGVSDVPAPGSCVLLGAGLLGAARRRRNT